VNATIQLLSDRDLRDGWALINRFEFTGKAAQIAECIAEAARRGIYLAVAPVGLGD